MTKIITEDKVCRGWHGLRILVAALLLAFIAWRAAEIPCEVIKPPPTQRDSISQG